MRILTFTTVTLVLCLSSLGCSSPSAAVDSSPEPASGPSAPPQTFGAPFGDTSTAPNGGPPAGDEQAPHDTSDGGDLGPDAEAPDAVSSSTPPSPTPPSPVPATPRADPGPAPTSACTVSKDADGFFWRTSSKSAYVGFVPSSYSSARPMRVVVGLHGCGDEPMNFARWGVNPWAGRATQKHIGISVGGETGGGKCWSMGADDAKVLAAVDDLAKCFWIDRSKVVVAGFSSGGQLAYRVGLTQASAFAGVLIEDSGLYAAGTPSATLLASAAWKIPVAHRAHLSDSVFPISKVRADWAALAAAGFPITTSEVAGTHDGTTEDWLNWLLPRSEAWSH